ncbi:hypothetical protein Tco_0156771, partial [Tanacetum coccineum]
MIHSITAAKSIEFNDKVKNVGASLDVAIDTNDVAGDGNVQSMVDISILEEYHSYGRGMLYHIKLVESSRLLSQQERAMQFAPSFRNIVCDIISNQRYVLSLLVELKNKDEDAPMERLDEEVEMPEGCEWEAPKIDNPKCEAAPASDEITASSVRDATWKPKFLVEKQNQIEEEQAANNDGLKGIQKYVFNALYKIAYLPIFGGHKIKVMEFIEGAEKKLTIVVGIILSLAVIVVVVVSLLLKIFLASKKKPGKGKVYEEQCGHFYHVVSYCRNKSSNK